MSNIVPLFFFVLITCSAFADTFEPGEVTFHVNDVLPPSLISGAHYKVDDSVKNLGYMDHFVIHSDYGQFSARSQRELRKRISEIAAIAQLKETGNIEVLADSAVDAAERSVKSLGHVVTDPVGTVIGLGSGISRLFQRTGKSIEEASEKLQSFSEKGNDKQNTADGTSATDTVANIGADVVKSQLGYNRERRRLSKELGVDPYSDNAVLNDELSRESKAATVGSLGFKLAAPTTAVLNYVGTAANLVWDLHPTDLRIRNEKSIAAMGISETMSYRFFHNRSYSFVRQTRFVTALEGLANVAQRQLLVAYATGAQTVPEAEYYTRVAELMAVYHKKRRLARIVGTGWLVPIAFTKADGAVLIVPVDHLGWTDEVAEAAKALIDIARREAGAGIEPELWIEGRISARAREELEKLGWRVRNNLQMKMGAS